VPEVPDVLERNRAAIAPPARPPVLPRTAPDERPARRSLHDQIGRLEAELGQLFCSTWPRKGVIPVSTGAGRGGPRLLGLAELEELRDELAERVSAARRSLSDRTYVEERNRRLIEEMTLEPERHKGSGCGTRTSASPAARAGTSGRGSGCWAWRSGGGGSSSPPAAP
jgi:hypothetical protein